MNKNLIDALILGVPKPVNYGDDFNQITADAPFVHEDEKKLRAFESSLKKEPFFRLKESRIDAMKSLLLNKGPDPSCGNAENTMAASVYKQNSKLSIVISRLIDIFSSPNLKSDKFNDIAKLYADQFNGEKLQQNPYYAALNYVKARNELVSSGQAVTISPLDKSGVVKGNSVGSMATSSLVSAVFDDNTNTQQNDTTSTTQASQDDIDSVNNVVNNQVQAQADNYLNSLDPNSMEYKLYSRALKTSTIRRQSIVSASDRVKSKWNTLKEHTHAFLYNTIAGNAVTSSGRMFFLAGGPGLGKTYTVLEYIDSLIKDSKQKLKMYAPVIFHAMPTLVDPKLGSSESNIKDKLIYRGGGVFKQNSAKEFARFFFPKRAHHAIIFDDCDSMLTASSTVLANLFKVYFEEPKAASWNSEDENSEDLMENNLLCEIDKERLSEGYFCIKVNGTKIAEDRLSNEETVRLCESHNITPNLRKLNENRVSWKEFKESLDKEDLSLVTNMDGDATIANFLVKAFDISDDEDLAYIPNFFKLYGDKWSEDRLYLDLKPEEIKQLLADWKESITHTPDFDDFGFDDSDVDLNGTGATRAFLDQQYILEQEIFEQNKQDSKKKSFYDWIPAKFFISSRILFITNLELKSEGKNANDKVINSAILSRAGTNKFSMTFDADEFIAHVNNIRNELFKPKDEREEKLVLTLISLIETAIKNPKLFNDLVSDNKVNFTQLAPKKRSIRTVVSLYRRLLGWCIDIYPTWEAHFPLDKWKKIMLDANDNAEVTTSDYLSSFLENIIWNYFDQGDFENEDLYHKSLRDGTKIISYIANFLMTDED